MTDPRYPVGNFELPQEITPKLRAAWLEEIANLPSLLRSSVRGLSPSQLDTPYREGGWTVRQVVHHLADSHMHSYIRCKFALSMDNPTIMPYDEAVWAQFEDGAREDVELSLQLITSLHARWIRFLRSLDGPGYARTLLHPENGPMTIDTMISLYAWHGRHHLAHITELRRSKGW
ncbi:MAG: putative metal-dependent hydrolase [Acidobacteria bacterium]|nr:putative metal-dependent hydrolase [Acidobacteriota bacterium]